MTKEEYEKALENLRILERKDNFKKWGGQVAPQINCDVVEQLIKEHFDIVKKIEWLKEEMTEPAFNLVFSTQEFLHNWYKGIQMYSAENDVLKRKVSEYENPQPYKFEELHEGMWVWDDKEKECIYITKTFIPISGFNVFTYLGIYQNLEELKKLDMLFEENRFYPVTKAMEYQK